MHHPIDRIVHTTAFVTPVVQKVPDGSPNKRMLLKDELKMGPTVHGARCSSMVDCPLMGLRIDPSWVTKAMVCAILSVEWCI